MESMDKACVAVVKKPDGSDGYHGRTLQESDHVYTSMERFYTSLHKRSQNFATVSAAMEIKFDYLDPMSSITALQDTMSMSNKKTVVRVNDDGYEATDSEEEEEEVAAKKKPKGSRKSGISPNKAARTSNASRASMVAATKKAMINQQLGGQQGRGKTSMANVVTAASINKTIVKREVGFAGGPTPCVDIDIVKDIDKDSCPKYKFEDDDTDVFTPKKPNVGSSSAARYGQRRGHTVIKKIETSGLDAGLERLRKSSRGKAEGGEMAAKQMVKRVAYKKMLLHPAVSLHAKANRVYDALEEALHKLWVTSRQLALVMFVFQQGSLWRAEFFGTYRVELVISVFHRIVDLHNFDLVLHYLTADEIACIYCRLGFLNVYNPMKPEGCYKLNIGRHEQRQLLKMVITLTDVEPGVNFKFAQYHRTTDSGPLPGWDLPAGWLVEKNIPNEGIVGFQYYAGGGTNQQGCRVMTRFRRSLLQLVLLSERELNNAIPGYDTSGEFTTGELEVMNNREGEGISDMWYDFLTINASTNYYRRVIMG